ncbi:MAG: cytochrome c-type biogenesis protein [Maritimibacter sp.]
MIKRLSLVFALLAAPVFAVNPDEVLKDPVLESRAREVSAGLRCVVCRGESIDESNAMIARDLRVLVRERLVAGDSNDEVLAYVVDRYGEYVLMKPLSGGANMLLWGAGPVLFVIALLTSVMYLRRRSTAQEPGGADLSDEEQARVEELLQR